MGQKASNFFHPELDSDDDYYTEMDSRLLELRKDLMTAVHHGKDNIVINQLLDKLIKLPCPVSLKYALLNEKQILQLNNKSVDDLKKIPAAFGILEKYGRHLLKPVHARAAMWRSVKYSNPIYKGKIEPLNGSQQIMNLMGYSLEVTDGVYFPEKKEPDVNHTVNLVIDILMARREMELYLNAQHPRPEDIEQFLPPQTILDVKMLNGTLTTHQLSQYKQFPSKPMQPSSATLQTTTLQQQLSQYKQLSSNDLPTPAQAPVQISNEPAVPPMCEICLSLKAETFCKACNNKMMCLTCDQSWHQHPRRQNHEQKRQTVVAGSLPQTSSRIAHQGAYGITEVMQTEYRVEAPPEPTQPRMSLKNYQAGSGIPTANLQDLHRLESPSRFSIGRQGNSGIPATNIPGLPRIETKVAAPPQSVPRLNPAYQGTGASSTETFQGSGYTVASPPIVSKTELQQENAGQYIERIYYDKLNERNVYYEKVSEPNVYHEKVSEPNVYHEKVSEPHVYQQTIPVGLHLESEQDSRSFVLSNIESSSSIQLSELPPELQIPGKTTSDATFTSEELQFLQSMKEESRSTSRANDDFSLKPELKTSNLTAEPVTSPAKDQHELLSFKTIMKRNEEIMRQKEEIERQKMEEIMKQKEELERQKEEIKRQREEMERQKVEKEKLNYEQIRIKQSGEELMNIVKKADLLGFDMEEIEIAVEEAEKMEHMDAVQWLKNNWQPIITTVAFEATEEGKHLNNNTVGKLTAIEAKKALIKSKGDMEMAITDCVESRKKLYQEINSQGDKDPQQVLDIVYQCSGDLEQSQETILQMSLKPFLDRIYENEECFDTILDTSIVNVQPSIQNMITNKDMEIDRRIRMILVEGKLKSWGRAETVVRIIDQELAKPEFEESSIQDVIEAAKNCGDLKASIKYLQQECEICFALFPMNKITSLNVCRCKLCRECTQQYFKDCVMEKNIRKWGCPICSGPNMSDAQVAEEYLSFIKLLISNFCGPQVQDMFDKKANLWSMQQDPNFRWCAHCDAGFIFEGQQLSMRCNVCGKRTCFKCKKEWEVQHEGLTCEEYEQWKIDNDPTNQAVGLAKHLEDNGIDCPSCKMRFALSKGGCMHFTCPECSHEFCSGCSQPFYHEATCPKKCGRGLHCHHPRDCFYHLRDEDPKTLQSLLQKHNKNFSTTKDGPNVCPVMEQKERASSNIDEACGKEVKKGWAGLCLNHYKEYLVGLINKHSLDPLDIIDDEEKLKILCLRLNIKIDNLQGNDIATRIIKLKKRINDAEDIRQNNR